MNHKPKHKPAVPYLDATGPPSSPPITILLPAKIPKRITEQTKKTKTVNPSFPAGTS